MERFGLGRHQMVNRQHFCILRYQQLIIENNLKKFLIKNINTIYIKPHTRHVQIQLIAINRILRDSY